MSRHRERLGRRHHDGRATRTSGIVDGDRVVGPVRRDTGDVAVDRIDQMESSCRVIDMTLGQGFGDDHARSVDREMERLVNLTVPTRMMESVFRNRLTT